MVNFEGEILRLNDTKKSSSNNQFQFYEKNPFQSERQKKSNCNNPLQFY